MSDGTGKNEYGQIVDQPIAEEMAYAEQQGKNQAAYIERTRLGVPEKEAQEWLAVMEEHQQKRPEAWHEIFTPDGQKMIITRFAPDTEKEQEWADGEVYEDRDRGLAITESGAVHIIINHRLRNKGQAIDWSNLRPDIVQAMKDAGKSEYKVKREYQNKDAYPSCSNAYLVEGSDRYSDLIFFDPVPKNKLGKQIKDWRMAENLDRTTQYIKDSATKPEVSIKEVASF